MEGSNQAMNMGTVAERSGVPPKTIRYYESIGLIRSADRQANGYRAFTEVDMHELHFIKRARRLGFSVEEVRELLDLWHNTGRSSAAVKAVVARHVEALERKIAELKSMRRTLADLIERCRGDDRPDCPILDDLQDEGTSNVASNRETASRKVRVSMLRSHN
jgi:MerR family copper efflux transcriptional regulator